MQTYPTFCEIQNFNTAKCFTRVFRADCLTFSILPSFSLQGGLLIRAPSSYLHRSKFTGKFFSSKFAFTIVLGHFQVCKNCTFLQRGVFRVFPFLALAFFTRVSDANEICALWKSIAVLALCFIWSFGVIQINRALFLFASTNFSSFVSKCKFRDINLF